MQRYKMRQQRQQQEWGEESRVKVRCEIMAQRCKLSRVTAKITQKATRNKAQRGTAQASLNHKTLAYKWRVASAVG